MHFITPSLEPPGEDPLSDLCQSGVLVPDETLQCRYRITASAVVVDVLSPQGFNVGGVNSWFERAATRAGRYAIGKGRTARAVTPPYFLATKLVAFEDRGPDAQSSKDAEDIVALAVEVPSLMDEVEAEGMLDDVARLWERVFRKHGLSMTDVPELVSWHLDRRDRVHEDRVIRVLRLLAGARPR